jgi:hypothetical protein
VLKKNQGLHELEKNRQVSSYNKLQQKSLIDQRGDNNLKKETRTKRIIKCCVAEVTLRLNCLERQVVRKGRLEENGEDFLDTGHTVTPQQPPTMSCTLGIALCNGQRTQK